MPIRLWELAGADPELRFSPFVWRIRMALVHKGIDWKGVAWRFTEKEAIAPANSIRVPVIEDGGKWVADSWVIANYLEDTYRARPLFGGPGGRALSRFYTDWTDTVLHPAIFRLVLGDIFAVVHEKDRDYFRRTREERVGMSIEEFGKDRERHLPALRQVLTPLRQTLKAQAFLGGEAPLYPDYIVFGAFMWARCISPLELVPVDDSVGQWIERMLGAFDGHARAAKRAA